MGKVKDYLFDILARAEDLLQKQEKASAIDQPVSLELTKQVESESNVFQMQEGPRLTPEEKIKENEYLISTLDSRLMFILKMINELHDEQDAINVLASDPLMMRAWLAHISYKTKIENFSVLITGQNKNLLDPTVLAGKKNRPAPKPKKIKCLQDLPLQKSLLN